MFLPDVYHRRKISSNGDVETDVLNKDIVRTGFDGNAVIATLVDHVGKTDIVGIHSVKTVGVLDPVDAIWSIDCGGVVVDIIKGHVGTVHNIERPEGRVLHEDCDILATNYIDHPDVGE